MQLAFGDNPEIDFERKFIHYEEAPKRSSYILAFEKIIPQIYQGSKYAHCNPFVIMDVEANFPYQALRDYYKTWFRPDMQAIIVVGDIDANRIEDKIKDTFANIKMPENAPKRVYYPVPDNKGTIYALESVPNLDSAEVGISFKHDVVPFELKGNLSYLINQYLNEVISLMLYNRLNEIISKPDSPFTQAGVSYQNFIISKTKDAIVVDGIPKGSDITPTLQSIYREILRAIRDGFTNDEYLAAQYQYLTRLKNAYDNRNNLENKKLAIEYIGNFTDNEPIISIAEKFRLMQRAAKIIPLESVNQLTPMLFTPDNRVIHALIPEKEGVAIPTNEQLAAAIAAVDAEFNNPSTSKAR